MRNYSSSPLQLSLRLSSYRLSFLFSSGTSFPYPPCPLFSFLSWVHIDPPGSCDGLVSRKSLDASPSDPNFLNLKAPACVSSVGGMRTLFVVYWDHQRLALEEVVVPVEELVLARSYRRMNGVVSFSWTVSAGLRYHGDGVLVNYVALDEQLDTPAL